MVAWATKQLGLPSPCCLASRAALFNRAPPIKNIAALHGASKVAVGSSSFFRSSGSIDSANSGTPLCSRSSASYIYIISMFYTASLLCARAVMIQLFLRLRKKRESSLYVCSCSNCWQAICPAKIFREMGINYVFLNDSVHVTMRAYIGNGGHTLMVATFTKKK